MKICWDNLEDVYLTKNSNLRHNSRGVIYEKEECVVCGSPFLGKLKEKTCCRECSYIVTADFHKGRKRSVVTRRKISEKAKERIFESIYTTEYVRSEIEKKGYKLLTEVYKNNKQVLDLICSEGHEWKVRWHSFQKGSRCFTCFGKPKHTYEYVKEFIEKEGYKLISKEYIQAHSKLKIQCPVGHNFQMKYANFQQGQRCPVCNIGNQSSKSEKEVLDVVKNFTDEKIIENNRKQIINPLTGRGLELDIWIPSLKKAIEFNGTYWHKDKGYKDEQKVLQCEQKGINLMIIEESQWRSNKEKCINTIGEWLNES